jgi:hypothetical protein
MRRFLARVPHFPHLNHRTLNIMQKTRASAASAAPAVPGSDADGTKFKTAEELWQQERGKGLQENWYGSAISYWSTVPATVDGVLGGFGQVSPVDLTESAAFLDALAAQGCSTAAGRDGSRAVDCGAGVGRITAGLLMHRFARVDVVEPVQHFLAQALLLPLPPLQNCHTLSRRAATSPAAATSVSSCSWVWKHSMHLPRPTTAYGCSG